MKAAGLPINKEVMTGFRNYEKAVHKYEMRAAKREEYIKLARNVVEKFVAHIRNEIIPFMIDPLPLTDFADLIEKRADIRVVHFHIVQALDRLDSHMLFWEDMTRDEQILIHWNLERAKREIRAVYTFPMGRALKFSDGGDHGKETGMD